MDLTDLQNDLLIEYLCFCYDLSYTAVKIMVPDIVWSDLDLLLRYSHDEEIVFRSLKDGTWKEIISRREVKLSSPSGGCAIAIPGWFYIEQVDRETIDYLKSFS